MLLATQTALSCCTLECYINLIHMNSNSYASMYLQHLRKNLCINLTSIESSISGIMHFAIANLPSEMAWYSWGNLIMYIVNNMVMETLTVLSPSPIHLDRVHFKVELR